MPSDSDHTFWLEIFGEFVCWNLEISGDLLKVPIAACSENEKTYGWCLFRCFFDRGKRKASNCSELLNNPKVLVWKTKRDTWYVSQETGSHFCSFTTSELFDTFWLTGDVCCPVRSGHTGKWYCKVLCQGCWPLGVKWGRKNDAATPTIRRFPSSCDSFCIPPPT